MDWRVKWLSFRCGAVAEGWTETEADARYDIFDMIMEEKKRGFVDRGTPLRIEFDDQKVFEGTVRGFGIGL